jgi:multicomponent Na+:H+ antiporter subunit D
MNFLIDDAPALVVVLPLIVSAIIAFMPSSRWPWIISMITLVVHLFISFELLSMVQTSGVILYEFGNWQPPWGIAFKIDGINIGLQIIFSSFVLITTFYSRKIFLSEIHPDDSGKAYSLWLLAVGSLNGIILTNDIFNLFVFLEISALSSISLIALGAGMNRKALLAAFNYLIIGAIGATFYVIGVGFAYSMTGTLNMSDLVIQLSQYSTGQLAIFAGMSFMLIGLMVKSAVFPLHLWLPPAYSYAPSAVSTLFAALATKAILYFFVRLIYEVFTFYDHYLIVFLDYVLMPLSVSAIFVGTIIAIYQDDIKKLLAYSSIAQIGYITLAFSMNDQSGITAGFIHIFNHALIKGGLFMAIGYFAFSSQDRVTLSSINGYGQKYPITSFALLICGVSLIGIPLTNGFVSKLYLFQALYYNHMFITIALVAISSALAVIYFWKIVESLWFSSIKTEVVSEDPAIYIPLWIVAISIIIFGVFSAPIIELANMASINLFGGISN